MNNRFWTIVGASLLLASCGEQAGPPATPLEDAQEVQITMDVKSWESSDAVQRSMATLRITGAVQRDIPVFDGAGVMLRVDPIAHGDDASVVGIWSAWFAGGGEDVRVRSTGSGLVVEKRATDETQPGCLPWQPLTTVAMPSGMTLRLVADDNLVSGTPCAYQAELDALDAEGQASLVMDPENPVLTITLEKKETEGADGIVRTEGVLHLTGTLTYDVPLKDIDGTLSLVDPASYDKDYLGGTIIAKLTSWFGGHGKEIWITQYHGNPFAISVEYRAGDESGACGPPGLLADLALPSDVAIKLVGFGTPIKQSSLAWCDDEAANAAQ